MKIIRKENTDEILREIKDNDGFCKCKINKNQDTRCPCKEFREQNYIGECYCGLFEKVEENNK